MGFPMNSTWKRRSLFAGYVMAMLLTSALIVLGVFRGESMVQIFDREVVMQRRTAGVPATLVIEDPCWGAMELTPQSAVLDLFQSLKAIPRVKGEFPGNSLGTLSGTVTYTDGSAEKFALGSVLTLGNTVYYSRETQEALEELRQSLATRLYTVERLSAFFAGEYRILLSDGTHTLEPAAVEREALGQAVAAGVSIEDPEEAAQTVQGRTPRYLLLIQDREAKERLRLAVYANESTQVYGAYLSGPQMVLCFGGELVPLCGSILGIDEAKTPPAT